MSRVSRVLAAAGVVLTVVVGGGLLLPSAYSVERSVMVSAPPSRVFREVHDLRRSEVWSPFLASDPSYGVTYGPVPYGVGAWYIWHGDPGWGRLETVEVVAPSRLVNELYNTDMGLVTASWSFVPEAEGTRVSWSFAGDAEGVLGGWIAWAMDPMLGGMLADGLEGLAEAAEAAPDEDRSFDMYSYVLLRKGERWSDEDTEENRALMRRHLAHFSDLFDRGRLYFCGPFGHRDDADLRGMCLYRGDLRQARELAEQDPRVLAGQLRVDVMTLWTKEHALNLPP